MLLAFRFRKWMSLVASSHALWAGTTVKICSQDPRSGAMDKKEVCFVMKMLLSRKFVTKFCAQVPRLRVVTKIVSRTKWITLLLQFCAEFHELRKPDRIHKKGRLFPTDRQATAGKSKAASECVEGSKTAIEQDDSAEDSITFHNG